MTSHLNMAVVVQVEILGRFIRDRLEVAYLEYSRVLIHQHRSSSLVVVEDLHQVPISQMAVVVAQDLVQEVLPQMLHELAVAALSLLEELLRLQQPSALSHKLLDAINKVDLAQAIQPLPAPKVVAVVVEVTSVVVVAIAMQTSPTAAVVVVPASSTTPVWR
jgi:hypothetical protein